MTKSEIYISPMPSRRRKGYTKRMIYDFINTYNQENGFPPTVREIASAVGVSSPGTVCTHLRSLEKEHLIERDSYRARAIRTRAI